MDQMIDRATRAERAALEVDARLKNSEGAEFGSFAGRMVFANSHRFYGEFQSSNFSCSVSPIAIENGLMQRDYWYSVGCKVSQLDAPEAIGREAGHRTVRRLGTPKVATCRGPIVFDPEMAGPLLGKHFRGAESHEINTSGHRLVRPLRENNSADKITLVSRRGL